MAFGCDGINSSLRGLSEFVVDEWYYGQKAYVALVEAEHKNEAHQFFHNLEPRIFTSFIG